MRWPLRHELLTVLLICWPGMVCAQHAPAEDGGHESRRIDIATAHARCA